MLIKNDVLVNISSCHSFMSGHISNQSLPLLTWSHLSRDFYDFLSRPTFINPSRRKQGKLQHLSFKVSSFSKDRFSSFKHDT